MLDLQQLFYLISGIFCLLIAVPLISYHAYKYHQNRYHVIYQKRYAFITIYENIIAIFKFSMDGLQFLASFAQNSNITYKHWQYIADWLALFGNIAIHFIVLCMTLICLHSLYEGIRKQLNTGYFAEL